MSVGALKKKWMLQVAGLVTLAGILLAGLSIAGVFSSAKLEAASTEVPQSAKNVIIMVSDGCGYNHITATDYYSGKKQAYEQFPVRVGMSTFECERTAAKISTDSAAAATAMASGKRTFEGAIGVDVNGAPVELVTQRAEALGKATGVITSVEWSHATPAGYVAHNVSRNNYAAIAQEMIQSSGTDVIMGSGNPDFDDNGLPASEGAEYVGGADLWKALKEGTAGGDADGDGIADPWRLIQTKAEFESLAKAAVTPKRVCGTAQVYSTLQQSRGGDGQAAPYAVPLTTTLPDLATMTRGALNVLDDDRDGFFLMIEGGAIDWASHANQTGRTIEEEMDFNKAVDAVIAWVEKNSNWNETLLIVTADHETGNLWGPGSGMVNGTAQYTPVVDNGKGNVPGVSWNSPEHTNQLIPLYAKGAAGLSLMSYVRACDRVCGPYIDNTDLADLVFKAMK